MEFGATWRPYSRSRQSSGLARYPTPSFGGLQRPQKLRVAEEKVKKGTKKHPANVLAPQCPGVLDRKLPNLNPALRAASIRQNPAQRPSSEEILHPERRFEEDPRDKDGTWR